jgi:hypothetical protein
VAERFEVYSYEVRREGLPPEMRYSLTPVKGARYSGRGEPLDANPLADDPAEADQPEPAGHVEAPDGTLVVAMEPPTLEIPGHGQVDLLAVIGAGEGTASELGHLVRWAPRRA